jgi:hypothetical protein
MARTPSPSLLDLDQVLTDPNTSLFGAAGYNKPIILSFAKSLRRRHKDCFPCEVSISLLDDRLVMFLLAENLSRALSGFQEGEFRFSLQKYCF